MLRTELNLPALLPSRALSSLSMPSSRRLMALLLALAFPGTIVTAEDAAPSVRYGRDVRPILARHCFACHGSDPAHRAAELRLDSADEAYRDRPNGPAITPNQLAASEVWRRITTDDEDLRMPPVAANRRSLSREERDIIRRWIEQGAEYEPHWAFVPPVRPQVDATGSAAIDALLAAQWTAQGIVPAPAASPETLLRRVSLDLTGLPPTVAELDLYLREAQDHPTEAYAAAVDRLLASPHYGERWGRWWLDQARYADSNGYSIDAPRQIWKFRDWVIESLNADLPFDQFTIEQLAGDLLPAATDQQRIATGFHRNTQLNQEGGIDVEQFRIDSVFDRVATTGTVWLGLTVGCAQCHDHKYDPLSQREYYGLFAFFNNQAEPTLSLPNDRGLNRPVLQAELDELQRRLTDYFNQAEETSQKWEANLPAEFTKSLAAEVAKALQTPRPQRSFAERRLIFQAGLGAGDQVFRAMNERYVELDALLQAGVTTLVMQELDQPRFTRRLIKGDFTRPAETIEPGTPAILPKLSASSPRLTRLDLAHWLVEPSHPLTARVFVNRLWQQYFGRGLVETDSDFGLQGTPPTHPELLDWLATEFIARGWSMKAIHRTIVLSAAYQRSSVTTSVDLERDPENIYFARQRRLRLDAELVRDVALTASGLLSRKVGGPSVFPPIPEGVMSLGQVKRAWKVSPGEDRYRRGLYTFTYRATPAPALNVFDAPDGYLPCTRRIRSNTPLQALTLLNDAAFVECATALAAIIDQAGLATAFRRTTGRTPDAAELTLLGQYDSLTTARILLNLDETVTRE